jgi:hypothetical protein
MSNNPDSAEQLPSWLQLQSVIPLDGDKAVTVEKITTLSRDSIERNHADKIVDLSRRRVGMTLENALAIARGRVLDKQSKT